MTKGLTEIILQEDEGRLLTFLKSLTTEERKRLVPEIKKLDKHLHEFGKLEGNTYGHTNGNDKQRSLLPFACFVCFGHKDFEKSNRATWMLQPSQLAKVIEWHCPGWLSDYVNELVKLDYISNILSYDHVINLSEKGYVIPSHELLARLMPNLIYEPAEKNSWQYTPGNVLKRKITLEEHIWYLFQYESDIHYSGRWLRFNQEDNKSDKWQETFKSLVSDRLLDRHRLLKESLLASSRNFNKILSGWFSDLFVYLDPLNVELIQMQDELFAVLNSKHSKPVNTSLKFIKKIIGDQDFNISAFLDMSPVLLSSDVKATVELMLGILDKLAEKHAAHRVNITVASSYCYIHTDKTLQEKASKIISKYGDSKDELLRSSLSQAYENMLASTRTDLKEFLSPAEKPQQEVDENRPLSSFPEEEKIPFPTSVEDLVFLASQAFDNNQSWHIDILPAAILRFQEELTAEDLTRFEPAFQRAFNLLSKGLRSVNGYLDYLLALFFVDFGHWLFQRFGKDADVIRTIFKKYDQKKADGNVASYLVAPAHSFYVSEFKIHKKVPYLKAFRDLFELTLDRLKHNSPLPLLSSPTHTNGSLDSQVLISRLLSYQEKGLKASSIDLQVAISRCRTAGSQELPQITEKLVGEWKSLIMFLLSQHAEPVGPFHEQGAWMVAALRRIEKRHWPQFAGFTCCDWSINNYAGELKWRCIEEEYDSEVWDYDTRKYLKVKRTRKLLQVTQEKKEIKQESALKKLMSGIITRSAHVTPIFFDTVQIGKDYLDCEHNDVERVLSLMPHQCSPFLAGLINKCLGSLSDWSESEKRMVLAVLQFLYANWEHACEMHHLFLAACMICPDKSAANIAAEIWIKYAPADIDNTRIGQIIGTIEQIEIAPLKRFTDLINAQMLRVSQHHNVLLLKLTGQVLIQLPDKPIKGSKKLIEIYEELLVMTNLQMPAAVANRLLKWKSKS